MAGRLVVAAAGADRPGLLRDVASRLAGLGLNIAFSLALTAEGRAVLVFVADGAADASSVARRVREVEGVEWSSAAPLASAHTVVAEVLRTAPRAAPWLARYVGPGAVLGALAALERERMVEVLRSLDPEALRELVERGGELVAGELLEALGPERLASLLSRVSADEAADVLQALPEERRREVLGRMAAGSRELVARILGYPPASAGGLMVVDYPAARPWERAGEVLERVRSRRWALRDVVAVVDGEGRLVGLVETVALAAAPPGTRVGDLARPPAVTVSPWARLDDLLVLAARYGARRIPVVDGSGRLLGLVAAEDLVEAAAAELYGSVSLLEGLGPAPSYRLVTLVGLFRRRLPWVLAAYAVESAVAAVVKSFEPVVARLAAVAAFAPLVMALAGIVGGQSLAMAVHALASRELDPGSLRGALPMLGKSVATAIMVSALLAAASYAYVVALTGHAGLAASVALAHVVASAAASALGFALPVLAARAGLDPAAASSPSVQTLNDLLAALVYFAAASALV